MNSSSEKDVVNTSPKVIIVGAGFAGMYLLHRLRQLGIEAQVLEAGSGVGGTWYWNRYPGARCDIESAQYSFSFSKELEQDWDWTERYAAQPEILRYANHIVERFDLASGIELNTTVVSANFDEQRRRWSVVTKDGRIFTTQFCVMATGCLSTINVPNIDGLDSFSGESYHTGNWPHHPVSFEGQRVAVIGTGSSAIQSIPIIAEQAAQLTVFQRTPNYVVPAQNYALSDEERARIKRDYPDIRARARLTRNGVDYRLPEHGAIEVDEAARTEEFERRWHEGGLGFLGSFNDMLLDARSNKTAQEFIRAKIREIVDDPSVAELLTPDSTFGCKRLCVDIGYFETYNRDNVSLIDVSETPIQRVEARGVVVDDNLYEVDALVLATGFDAMTGTLAKIDIRGRGNLSLRDKWHEGPRMYLGLAAAGFPNFFTVTGPGSPSVLSNMMFSIEHHVVWISDCIAWMDGQRHSTIEATEIAEQRWVEHVNEVADATLYPSCNSWYLGANIPGKPRVFMPYIGVPPYVERCQQIADEAYSGFSIG